MRPDGNEEPISITRIDREVAVITLSCLVCDSLVEAFRIGLRRSWYQHTPMQPDGLAR